MEEITVFKTNDGKFFEDKKEAEKHEVENKIDELLTNIVDLHLYPGMNKEAVVQFIKDNRETLFSILSRKAM